MNWKSKRPPCVELFWFIGHSRDGHFVFIYLSNPTRLFKHIIHKWRSKFVRKESRIHSRTITRSLDCSMEANGTSVIGISPIISIPLNTFWNKFDTYTDYSRQNNISQINIGKWTLFGRKRYCIININKKGRKTPSQKHFKCT